MFETIQKPNIADSTGPIGAPKISHVLDVLRALRARLHAELQIGNGYDDHNYYPDASAYTQDETGVHELFVDNALQRNARLQLEQVNEALTRIEDGKYGICAGCLRPINPERLVVRPYATLCIECQASQDRARAFG